MRWTSRSCWRSRTGWCRAPGPGVRRGRRTTSGAGCGRREWATLIAGIYVDHTGAPTWDQRAMAGVLHARQRARRARADRWARPWAVTLRCVTRSARGGGAARCGPSWSASMTAAACGGSPATVRAGRRSRRPGRLDAHAAPAAARGGGSRSGAGRRRPARRRRCRRGRLPVARRRRRPEIMAALARRARVAERRRARCRAQRHRGRHLLRAGTPLLDARRASPRIAGADAASTSDGGGGTGAAASIVTPSGRRRVVVELDGRPSTTMPGSVTATSSAISTTWSVARSQCDWGGVR